MSIEIIEKLRGDFPDALARAEKLGEEEEVTKLQALQSELDSVRGNFDDSPQTQLRVAQLEKSFQTSLEALNTQESKEVADEKSRLMDTLNSIEQRT